MGRASLRAVVTPKRWSEPRWPVVLTVAVTFLAVARLPDHVRVFNPGVPALLGGGYLLVLIAASLGPLNATTAGIERWATFAIVVAGVLAVGLELSELLQMMVRRSNEVDGLKLLTTSVAIWIVNVMTFALLYWQVDRRGPAGRAQEVQVRPDWHFPQEDMDELYPEGWRPQFLDYLFLSFSTATAFSTTDVTPLARRAKLMMMAESAISLITIAMVAARAINVLGS
jgi:uncharacterized membrane protein